MNTLLIFEDLNGKIDAIDSREVLDAELLELRDMIKGKFLTL